MNIYVSTPIDRENNWSLHEGLIKTLEGFTLFKPFRAFELGDGGRLDSQYIWKVCELGLRVSDVIVILITGSPSVGCWREMQIALDNNIPVMIIAPDGFKRTVAVSDEGIEIFESFIALRKKLDEIQPVIEKFGTSKVIGYV